MHTFPMGHRRNRRTNDYFSAEDGIEDTIVARLKAQNADLTKITICKRIREMNDSGEMTRRGFNLTRDLPHLERLLDQHPDTKSVIIDPVSAYAGRADTHKNAEMRTEVLDPLSEMAERRGVAVIAITHWNKGSGGSLERISGSIAFPAAARQVWGFTADPEEATRTLMLFGKSNVGPRVAGLRFRISEIDGRATLTWDAGDVDQKLDDVGSERLSRAVDAFSIPTDEIPVMLGAIATLQAQLMMRLTHLSAPAPQASDGDDPMLTVEEVAEKLRCSTKKIYRLAPKVQWARKVGAGWLFSRNGLEKWLARQRV